MKKIISNKIICLSIWSIIASLCIGKSDQHSFLHTRKIHCANEGELTEAEGHCRHYGECVNGLIVHRSCPEGLVFDRVAKVCNFFSQVTDPRCFKGCVSSDDFSPAENCEQFYRCSNGILTQLTCAKGTVFDHINRMCNFPTQVHGRCGKIDKESENGHNPGEKIHTWNWHNNDNEGWNWNPSVRGGDQLYKRGGDLYKKSLNKKSLNPKRSKKEHKIMWNEETVVLY